MRRPTLLLALALLGAAEGAYAQVPHLTGGIGIDLPRGMLTGDICLADLPAQDTLRFVLHGGLNVKHVRDTSGRALRYRHYYDAKAVGEGLLYTLTDSLPHPRALCVEYVGAFPVYESEKTMLDYKGMITFNGRTVRATEQAKWYPIPYEPTSDQLHQALTYRLRVDCPACASIYVNGSAPAHGPRADFTSELPRPLLLYSGDFAFEQKRGVYYINGAVSDEAATVIGQAVEDIQRFYERFLDLPHGDAPVFLTFASPSIDRKIGESTWAFNTWPTLAFDGRVDFDSFLEIAGDRREVPLLRYQNFAHELGHYYFGTLRVPRGAYLWFFTESTAEYLALKALQHLRGEEAYRDRIRYHRERIARGGELVPLDRITDPAQIHSIYRYSYGPLLLLALEHAIGEEGMGHVLRTLLTAPEGTSLDYTSLQQAAIGAGMSPAAWERFERECIRTPLAAGCLP